MLRVVFDTNVLLSGLIKPSGAPGRALAAWRNGQFTLVLSEHILDELVDTLARPKLRKVLNLPPEEIALFELQLRTLTLVVAAPRTAAAVRDAKDEPILALVAAGLADLLVTGDGDLLAQRHDHPIETPAEFVRRF